MRDLPNRALEVFLEAIELPAHERAVFLQRAYAGDEELRQRVAALLAAHDRVGDFLEEPLQKATPEPRPEAPIGERPGDRIGRYKLLQQIGEGGWGVVYMAEQEEPVRRRVALKIIKQGMDTKSVIARFEAERQALALMDHPNIAKVFDAGATESGRPFFVMELVRGVKITEFCDQNSLSTRERLELFVQVCRAVQHAHQKGIIHRDIKPSNILVTTNFEGAALPVVIDFGIAKATSNQRLTNKTLFTAFDMLIGTPAYMSPEQAAFTNFDVDTRTDIYSLGVLLYELLTGSTPFDVAELMKTGLDEVRRVIREQEPVRPSTRLSRMAQKDLTNVAQNRNSEPPLLIRSVKGDLDWIAMKALEKDRTRRYETATGLAIDIQRFLANETVSARPPSTLYKFGKVVSRNKLLFSGICVIALLLILGLAVDSVSLSKERQARREADAALRQSEADKAKERQARREADAALQQAEADKEKFKTEAAKSEQVTQFLEDMLQGVGPSYAHGRDTAMLKEILDRTAQRVSTEMTNQPEIQIKLRTLIGRIYLEIGEYRLAAEIQRETITLDRTQSGAESAEVATALNDLGLSYARDVRPAAAVAAHEEALAIRQRIFGNDNTNVAESLNNLGEMYTQEGRNEEAEPLIRQALAIREKWFGTNSLETAPSLRSLCIILGDKGQWADAEAMAREVLAIRRVKIGPEDPLVATSLGDLAWTEGGLGRLDEAESLEREALAMRRKLLGETHQDVAKSLYMVGDRLRQRGKYDDALTYLNEALAMQLELHGLNHPNTLDTLHSLGLTFEAEGKFAEAETAYRKAVAGWRGFGETDIPQAAAAFQSLTSILAAQKKLGDAKQVLDQELTPEFVRQPSSAYLLTVRMNLLGREGRWQEAVTDNALLLQYQPSDHYNYHTMAGLLAITLDRPAYEKLCQTILAKFGDTTNPFIAERMSKDCLLMPNSGVDLERVDKLADTAVTAGTGNGNGWGMPWFVTAKALSNYRQGHFAEAIDWAEKSHDSSQPLSVAQADAILALADWQLGQKDKARNMLAEGDKLAPSLPPGHDPLDLGDSWVAWLFARIQLDEAAKLIQPVPNVEGPPNKPEP
jgi:serine/threonine protein kinase/tetratricopeptide (TPR) repeat protein